MAGLTGLLLASLSLQSPYRWERAWKSTLTCQSAFVAIRELAFISLRVTGLGSEAASQKVFLARAEEVIQQRKKKHIAAQQRRKEINKLMA